MKRGGWMPLSGLEWNGPRGFDIHLVRTDVTAPLINQLVVSWDGRDPFLATKIPADITTLTIRFQAMFAGAPSAFGAKLLSNNAVAAIPSPPGVQLRNFLVDASATDSASGKVFHQKIRIHLHSSVKHLWLAPNPLTVHQGAQKVRFSVMAQFDDGVIGELTGWHRLGWTSQTLDNVAVDPSSGELDVKVAGTDTVIELRLPGGAAGAPPDATATVHSVDPWSTPVDVNYVAGPSSIVQELAPGRNILFLADGFDGNSSDFDQLVRAIVQQLRTSPSTRPYDVCSDGINYWSAFTPSRQGGIGINSELFTFQRAGNLKGFEVPLPVDPGNAPAGQPWTLAQLIHQVGLPVPVDDPPGRPLSGPGGKLADWQTLYGPQITSDRVTYYNQPDPNIGVSWLDLATRTPVNDRDTAFYLAFGERPRVEPTAVFREPSISRLRINPAATNTISDDLNSFLTNLQFQGVNIGARWALNGSDFGLAFILARTNHNGGVNNSTNGYIVAALGNDQEHVLTPASGGLGVDVQPEAVPTTPNVALTSAVAHEAGHSFGLGDEYGELQNTQAWLTITPDAAKSLAQLGNVQADADLRKTPNGPIDRSLFKWNWPRLQKAGICKGRPGFVGTGTVQVQLQPGHASLFRKGDKVRLRGRNLLPSGVAGAPAPMPLSTYLLTVETIEQGDVLTLDASAADPDPSTYPDDSLVVCPVQDSNGNDIPLIAPFVMDYLIKNQGPLNRPDKSPLPVCVIDTSPKQTIGNVPTSGFFHCKPRKLGTLVALWDGGARFHCGVYHPTGFCMMRARVDGNSIVSFCPVCRYVLVDSLDPTKHGIIDDDYSKQYPQP